MSIGFGRASTLQFAQMNRDFISRSTVSLQQVGKELATGRRSDIFLDLGPSATASLTLRAREDETQSYLISNTLLQGKLQTQLDSVDAIRGQVQGVLETVLANATSPTAGAETLQLQARSALEVVISQLNVSFNGEAIFAGTRSGGPPLTQYSKINSATGFSPEDVINSIVSGPPSSLTEVQSVLTELDAVFASVATDPNLNFEATFFSGTPELDISGQPSKRVSARIEPGLELQYGVQANDETFRDIIKGLAMLAATDVSMISQPDVYVAWMDEVTQVLGNASSKALGVSAEIGFRQQTVETTQKRLDAISMLQVGQIGELENVDPYEAATRMKSLETQLMATYEITAQMSRLSLLNYL